MFELFFTLFGMSTVVVAGCLIACGGSACAFLGRSLSERVTAAWVQAAVSAGSRARSPFSRLMLPLGNSQCSDRAG